MAPVLETSKRHGLLLWEDCAQVFTGRQGYLGHPESDAVFFSFGVIKRATAFGGGVARLRDDATLSGTLQYMQRFVLVEYKSLTCFSQPGSKRAKRKA